MLSNTNSQDPALSAQTFVKNPTLSAALDRIKQRANEQVAPPTEKELNAQYLAVNDWQRVDISGVDAWEDPIGGGAYEFENALAVQSARDVRDDFDTPLGELYGGE